MRRLYIPAILVLLSNCSPGMKVQALAQQGFEYRGHLGWVRDLASEPRPGEEWPSIGIDDQLIRDYDHAAAELSQDGIREFEIWGLLASHSYPAGLPLRIPAERKRLATQVVHTVQKHGVRVLAGTGIYSWGFDSIVSLHPEISCPNSKQIADPTSALSWRYQRAIMDALFALGIDGIELQPGDQGRCQCGPRCAAMGDDAAYYAAIIQQSADYVRRRYPGKLLFIGGYGIDLSHPADPSRLSAVLRKVDVYTDVGNTTAPFRKQLSAALRPAVLGGIAAPGISPPQHLARDHWFLPTFHHQLLELKRLYNDGGRSSENFMRIFANPSDEISMRLVARYEADPSRQEHSILSDLIQEIYEPADAATREALCSIFMEAESAYFDNAQVNLNFDLELEPLVGSQATPLIYLSKNLNNIQRAKYRARLQAIRSQADGLRGRVKNSARLQQVILCLNNVLSDLSGIVPSSSEGIDADSYGKAHWKNFNSGGSGPLQITEFQDLQAGLAR